MKASGRRFYLKELHERQTLDILREIQGIGPHRDDLFFYVSGKLLKAFGSQGQQRSAALALKLAQLEYVKNNTGEYPVLLLDDVMSELDSERRTHLLKFIDGRVQTFITVNDKHLIPDLNNNAYFYIENGKGNAGLMDNVEQILLKMLPGKEERDTYTVFYLQSKWKKHLRRKMLPDIPSP